MTALRKHPSPITNITLAAIAIREAECKLVLAQNLLYGLERKQSLRKIYDVTAKLQIFRDSLQDIAWRYLDKIDPSLEYWLRADRLSDALSLAKRLEVADECPTEELGRAA